MKVITLLGSAKKKGNTATVLGWAEDELRAMGHEVERVHLATKKISGCRGCAKCKEFPDKIACIQKDDAPEILEKMISAQLTIFASPVYFWGFSAQMKAILDRGYSLVCNYHKPDHTSLVEGQRQALLVTGADAYENNAEPLFTAFGRITDFYKANKTGELYIGGCTTPDQMAPDVRDKAIAFARQITG